MLNQAELDAKKQQQAPPPNATYCNGQYWTACPVGDNFVCPATGDAYCEIPISAEDVNRAANETLKLIEEKAALEQQQAAQQQLQLVEALYAEYLNKEQYIITLQREVLFQHTGTFLPLSAKGS